MKNDNKQLIAQGLAEHKPLGEMRALISTITIDELKSSYGESSEKLTKAIELCRMMSFPLKVRRTAIKPKETNTFGLWCTKGIISSAVGIGTKALLRRLPGPIGFVCSMATACASDYLTGKVAESKAKPQKPIRIEETVVSTADEICTSIDKTLEILRFLLTEPPKCDVPAKLANEHPDVLRWYQDTYSYSSDFDEKFAKHVRGRIESILRQNGYKLVTFDGTNERLFEREKMPTISEPIMVAPSIIEQSSGKLILAGKVFFPEEK